MLWAGNGQLDNLIDSAEHAALDIDSDVIHHTVDEHHDGHDCHMSAHLVGLSSQVFSLANIDAAQVFPNYITRFYTHQLPPPNKPPRA